MISKRAGVRLLIVITAVVAAIGLLLPRIPQPQSYHMFADQRSFLGIPNFGDVVSNLPFAVVGVCGLVSLLRSKTEPSAVYRSAGTLAVPDCFRGTPAYGIRFFVLSPAPK